MSFLDFKIAQAIFGLPRISWTLISPRYIWFPRNEFLGLLHPKDIFGLPRMSFLDFNTPQCIIGFPRMSFMEFKIPQDIFGLPRMRGVRYGRSRLPTVFARLTSPLPPRTSNRKENLIILRNHIPSPVSH